MAEKPVSVLFLCTGNAARSQMAEAIVRHLSHGRIQVASAGNAPQHEIHPMARQAIRTMLGTELTNQHPKSMQQFLGSDFDYVITVCDRVAETCPVFPGDPDRMHWSFPDPAEVPGTEEERQRAFDTIATQLITRVRLWMSLPSVGGISRLASNVTS